MQILLAVAFLIVLWLASRISVKPAETRHWGLQAGRLHPSSSRAVYRAMGVLTIPAGSAGVPVRSAPRVVSLSGGHQLARPAPRRLWRMI